MATPWTKHGHKRRQPSAQKSKSLFSQGLWLGLILDVASRIREREAQSARTCMALAWRLHGACMALAWRLHGVAWRQSAGDWQSVIITDCQSPVSYKY